MHYAIYNSFDTDMDCALLSHSKTGEGEGVQGTTGDVRKTGDGSVSWIR